jgi:hypothetical protein
VVVEGEVDSFGREVSQVCVRCARKAWKGGERHAGACDVVDRAGFFWVSEGTNHDGYGSWFGTFTSYREAVAYLRLARDWAARWGGLYPNMGVREAADAAELASVKADHDRTVEEETASLVDLMEEEDWRPTDDDGDLYPPSAEIDDETYLPLADEILE